MKNSYIPIRIDSDQLQTITFIKKKIKTKNTSHAIRFLINYFDELKIENLAKTVREYQRQREIFNRRQTKFNKIASNLNQCLHIFHTHPSSQNLETVIQSVEQTKKEIVLIKKIFQKTYKKMED